jgi:ankyrin repeat protein
MVFALAVRPATAQHAITAEMHLEFLSALESGDPHAIRSAVARGMNPYQVLRHALSTGKPSMMRLAVEVGVDPSEPDSTDSERRPPILQVAQNSAMKFIPADSAAEMVRVLLAGGARAEMKARRHMYGDANLVTIAATYGDPQIVRILLEHGANPRARGTEGKTALMFVANERNMPADVQLEIARSLIAHGADVAAKDDLGRTAADHAKATGADGLARMLANPATATTTARTAPSPSRTEGARGPQPGVQIEFLDALVRGDPARVAAALDRGAEINRRLVEGCGSTSRPLAHAIWYQNLDVARLLLERGAEVEDSACERGESALSNALMLASGATPLKKQDPAALRREGVELAHSLLARGASPNRIVPGGLWEPPQSLLERHADSPEILLMLLEAGADPNMATVISSGLIDHLLRPQIAARLAPADLARVVRAAVARGADVNKPGEQRPRARPLERARALGNAEVIRILEAAGAR